MFAIAAVLAKEKKTLFVNAFNGSRFDAYFLYKEYLRRNIKAENIRNNGAIIACHYKNIKFIDLSKHLLGSLSANLKTFNCNVQKGDFDHDKATAWEVMPEVMRADCIKYLEADVLGLRELYNKFNTTVFDKYSVNVSSYISTSSLTFNMWKRAIRVQKFDIQLPTLKQEKAYRQGVRGARNYKSKNEFISEQYDAYKKGQTEYVDLDDYIIDADVVSLYPAAMAQNEYPVGDCLELGVEKHMMGKMGIYKIKYITNKRLAHAILGRRNQKTGGLIWDLADGEGWYSSVEIEDALDNDYQIEILDGFYWLETAPVFTDYIEDLFKTKEELAKAGKKGSVAYTLSKLFMNGLYGKMIQRPIYEETKNISSVSDYWKFYAKFNVKGITKINNDLWEVTGSNTEQLLLEKRITKPTHYGVFILAYSRRIMLNYIKQANPYFDHENKYQKEQIENDFHYTDTDSLQMKASCANRIAELGDKSLGMITDDLGDNCKIIKGLWISPKLYMLEYVKEGDPPGKTHYHFRGKGLDKKKLTPEIYEKMAEGKSVENVRDFQMKKIHVSRNSKQQHIPMFSILHQTDIKKMVNSNVWAGRDFTGNDSTPWGHQ
jgi:hypothetical protein